MRDLINIIDTITEAWVPAWTNVRVYNTPTAISLYHATDESKPEISTKAERLIPHSISTTKRPDYIWGNKVYKFKIPAGTRVAELPSIFSILPPDTEDTPLNIGAVLQKWAIKNKVQILKIGAVGGVGTEWAILDPALIEKYTKV